MPAFLVSSPMGVVIIAAAFVAFMCAAFAVALRASEHDTDA